MQDFNLWILENLGTWTIDYFGLWLTIAAALALILIITLIAVAACHAKNKKKINALKSKADGANSNASAVDEAQLREQIRAEIAAEQGNSDQKAQEAYRAAELLSARVDEQNRTIEELEDGNKEKQNRINELSAMLEQSNQNAGSVNNDLYRQINELSQTTREQENEINLLKAENAQIKAQALQQQLAAASNDQKQPPRAAKKTVATETTAVADTEDDDDEYDEYYDDYGDETSAVKVTLKFDRIKNNWVILRSDTDRTYRRLATKQEALVIAKDLARRLHAQLAVHKKDGKFQKV